MKKRAVAFTIAGDPKNKEYAQMLTNSLRKFHTEQELPLLIYDLSKQAGKDPSVYYKATPMLARELLKDYDLVLKLDADQIITGDLNHILDDESYDLGTVLNWNRVDPAQHGLVQVWDIDPGHYFNCGLVAMRSETAVEHWWKLCNGPHFGSYQYREQDILNIICHYGTYAVKCLDFGDTWNGLISKGEWPRTKLQDGALVVEPIEIKDGKDFPEKRKTLKVLHWAGGAGPDKMNYRIAFQEDVIARLDYLVSPNAKAA